MTRSKRRRLISPEEEHDHVQGITETTLDGIDPAVFDTEMSSDPPDDTLDDIVPDSEGPEAWYDPPDHSFLLRSPSHPATASPHKIPSAHPIEEDSLDVDIPPFDDSGFFNTEIPANLAEIGFKNGHGKKLAPSAAAIEKAAKLCASVEDLQDSVPAAQPFVGFQNLRGVSLQPSAAALAKAKQAYDSDDDNAWKEESLVGNKTHDEDFFNAPDTTIPSFTGFQTLRGASLAPSAAALEKARKLIENDVVAEDTPVKLQESFTKVISALAESINSPGPQNQIKPLLPGPLLHFKRQNPIIACQKPIVPETPSKEAIIETLPRSPPRNVQAIASTSQTPQTVVRKRVTGFKTPFSTPRPVPIAAPAHATPAPATPSVTPSASQSKKRLGLVSSPYRRDGRPKPSFVTPFKNGKRPTQAETAAKVQVGEEQRPALANVKHNAATAPLDKGKGKLVETRKVCNCVFNLDGNSEDRIPLENWGNAQNSISELESWNVAPEAIYMDYRKAETHRFFVTFGVFEGFEKAHQDLLDKHGCRTEYCSLDWVQNHWALIVWKLAALSRSRPEEAFHLFTYESVVCQLLYRYEREINNAHRSAIKRIQEQDSSASQSMVLCVSQIFWQDPSAVQQEDPHDDRPQAPIVGNARPFVNEIELTDGWYRIRAPIDGSLRHAVERGRLGEGDKITITGAKSDAGREADEVLKAYDRSSLIISGNSCSLAHWASKLGFHRYPFVAGFTSLSANGGLVALMDVEVYRVYNVGYTEVGPSQPGQAPRAPWSMEEEQHEQAEWERQRNRERSNIMTRFERSYRRALSLVDRLVEAAHNSSVKISTKPNSFPEDIYDEMEDEPERVSSIINGLTAVQIQGVIEVARRRSEDSRANAPMEVEKELQAACPPRNSRAFRIVRIRDARTTKKTSIQRDAQLRIWDPLLMPDGAIAEGKRYMITNLMPFQASRWPSPKHKTGEIYLTTRRDTKWRIVPS